MDLLKTLLYDELPLALLWLLLALSAGFIYSIELMGVDGTMSLLSPERARSLHISLMLYGFFPLFLSLLPFALFEKEGVLTSNALAHLRRYLVVWNFFLLFMTMALLFGNLRGLPFYDFPYQLNFLLAFSGVFYLFALVDALRQYEKRPLWVNVSLAVVVIAPILLVVLMNPDYGQVEKTLSGPHGDNTLGMSFALMPLYYLLIKLVAKESFVPRWHWLWMIPLVGYILSLLIRNFFHNLTYNEEWFFQYLTLLYVPLLWRWWRDAGLRFKHSPYLFFSIVAFIAVDIEGNILFIPELRQLIHRNDLVVAHAHIAMGIAVAFMSLTILHRYLPGMITRACAIGWTTLVALMALSLSIAGMVEGGFINVNLPLLWGARSLFGVVLIVMVGQILWRRLRPKHLSLIGLYHFIGFLSDFGGGMVLILLGGALFPLFGFHFSGTYEYIVFAFMMGTGLVHWFGMQSEDALLANVSASIRSVVAAVFVALYWSGALDKIALLVALYDGSFALLYWLYLRGKA
jgi:hypothetical protein